VTVDATPRVAAILARAVRGGPDCVTGAYVAAWVAPGTGGHEYATDSRRDERRAGVR
jgi:hypothetical protein